jgi:hypothetical protein
MQQSAVYLNKTRITLYWNIPHGIGLPIPFAKNVKKQRWEKYIEESPAHRVKAKVSKIN